MKLRLRLQGLLAWLLPLTFVITTLPQLYAQESIITLRTSKAKGEQILFGIESTDSFVVEGAKENGIDTQTGKHIFVLDSEDGQVSVKGSVVFFECSKGAITLLDLSKNTHLKGLNCSDNQLSALDVTMNTKLQELHCDGNQLTSLNLSNQGAAFKELRCTKNHIQGAAMDALIASLPKRNYNGDPGVFMIFDNSNGNEHNTCTTTQAAKAKERGWGTYMYNKDKNSWVEYVPDKFLITYTQPTNGSLAVKKGIDAITSNSSVEIGTELTIVATADKDYELKNGKALLSGKELILTREGQVYTGTFIVEAPTEVSVEFVATTALEAVDTPNLLVYPNPAGNLVRISNASPSSKVALYSMDGVLLRQAITDAKGETTLSIATLPIGHYLVQTGSSRILLSIRR